MASPFFFVSKKDSKLQPCQDYQYLNDWMVKNSYPLPLISEIMDKLKGAKYFTRIEYLGMIIEQGKSLWTLSNLEELGTGLSLLHWNKHNLSLDLETFTKSLILITPN
jgi:hypothetical protein